MNLETYSNTELVQVRDDLRAMCVSPHVIDYVLMSLRMAFVMGGKDSFREAIGKLGGVSNVQSVPAAMLAASGEEC